MAYRNKTYVCFDADTDMHYYRLMQAWKENDNIAFNFHNAHDLNNLRQGSSEATIKNKLRERLQNTKVMVVLIGRNTKFLYKFVRWEIEYAIENDIPIVCVNIESESRKQDEYCPPILKNELAIYIPFNPTIVNIALNDWPAKHEEARKLGKTGPFIYSDTVYDR